MKKLLLLTGDIAAGKTTFSRILAQRYKAAVFQKDSIKEILGDHIGFHSREENKRLSNAAVGVMCHILSQTAPSGSDLILEANFHESELNFLHAIAAGYRYQVLTLVLRGDTDVLHKRYLHRMTEQNRHPVHLSTTVHIKEDFDFVADQLRREPIPGEVLSVSASDFAYQTDPILLEQIDAFMNRTPSSTEENP